MDLRSGVVHFKGGQQKHGNVHVRAEIFQVVVVLLQQGVEQILVAVLVEPQRVRVQVEGGLGDSP